MSKIISSDFQSCIILFFFAMSKSTTEYLTAVIRSIVEKDGKALAELISASSVWVQELVLVELGNMKQSPLFGYFNDAGKAIMVSYKDYVKAARKHEAVKAYTAYNDLVKAVNRLAEATDVWVILVLKVIVRDLNKLANDADKQSQAHLMEANYDFDQEKYLEQASRTINRSFTICLNDRELDPQLNKKEAVYYFVCQLYSIYFRLNKFDLAKSVQRALDSKINELPHYSQVAKATRVTYLYYSSWLLISQGNFAKAEGLLTEALNVSKYNALSQQESILLLLVPIKFITKRQTPSKQLWAKFPRLAIVYRNLFTAVKQGNLHMFSGGFSRLEKLLLKRQLYLAVANFKKFVILRLFRRTYSAMSQIPELFPSLSQLPLSGFARALEVSLKTSNGQIPDLTECYIANQISNGYIKGYISHSNAVVVLSKKEPFPKLIQQETNYQ